MLLIIIILSSASPLAFTDQPKPAKTSVAEPQPQWAKDLENYLVDWDKHFRKAIGDKKYNECISVNARLNACAVAETTPKSPCSRKNSRGTFDQVS